MGIGRRRFLQFVGAVLGDAALVPGVARPAVSVVRDTYVNRVLGLGFVVPPDWHLQQGQDFSFLRRDTTLLGMDDELRRALDTDPHADPVAVLSAVPVDEFAESGVYGPSIVIHFEPAYTLDGIIDDDRLVERYLALLEDIVPDYERTGAIEHGALSDCETWTVPWRFRFEHPKLPAPVRNDTRTVVILAEDGVYTIHLHHAPSIGATADAEHRKFLESLMIV